MRDPNRISKVLGLLKTGWSKVPDLRLGQIFENIKRYSDKADLFYLEDEDFEQLIKDYFDLEDLTMEKYVKLQDVYDMLDRMYKEPRHQHEDESWHSGVACVACDIMDVPTVELAYDEAKVCIWTGILPKDYAHAEGLPSYATPEQRKSYLDMFSHITHCSVCATMFDDREVRHWKFCPHCGAKVKEN